MNKSSLFGVYVIRNQASQMLYIGGTRTSFDLRWRQHQATLNNGTHENRALQSAWKAEGKDAFEFVVVEVVSSPALVEDTEQTWIDRYSPGQLYNQRRQAIVSLPPTPYSQLVPASISAPIPAPSAPSGATLTARQARAVAAALKEVGYGSLTIGKVRELGYVNAIAEFCEPMDLDAQNKVRRIVCEAAGIQPKRSSYDQ